jgi:predicted transposase/invertase (TIGR01784 family)
VTQLLRPTLDVVFKLLFSDKRNENLLRSLVSTLIEPGVPIAGLEVLNPETTKESVQAKGAVLDVRVRLENRCQLNIEMQSSAQLGLKKRALFYWARLYAGSLERGQPYSELLPTISLFILDFAELPTTTYHSEFRLVEVVEHQTFSEDLVLHVVELPKVPPLTATGPERTSKEPLLLKWARFLKAETIADLEPLAMTDPVFQEAKDALERLSDDPKARELARERELWDWNYLSAIRSAETRGRAEGLADGRAEGLADGRAQGERLLLQRQLTRKFGELAAAARERLERASVAELESWGERVLSASTLDEVFSEPAGS